MIFIMQQWLQIEEFKLCAPFMKGITCYCHIEIITWQFSIIKQNLSHEYHLLSHDYHLLSHDYHLLSHCYYLLLYWYCHMFIIVQYDLYSGPGYMMFKKFADILYSDIITLCVLLYLYRRSKISRIHLP